MRLSLAKAGPDNSEIGSRVPQIAGEQKQRDGPQGNEYLPSETWTMSPSPRQL